MNTRDRAASRAFLLTRTVELDLKIGADTFSLRIELLQSRGKPELFRARFWRSEVYRIQPTYPIGDDGEPRRAPTDETMRAEWVYFPVRDFERFEAGSVDLAERYVLDELGRFLDAHNGMVW